MPQINFTLSHKADAISGKWLILAVISLFWLRPAEAEIVWSDIQDPNVKDALYESYQGHHFEAITRLKMAQKLGRVLSQEKAGLVLGGLYLNSGFHDQAAKIFEAFLATSQPKTVQNQAWYYLAKTRYEGGDYDGALQALYQIQDSEDFAIRQSSNLLKATILLKQGKDLDSLVSLNKVNERSDWGLYAKFNKGVATYRLGKEKEGIKILDEIGSISSKDLETQAISDRANMVLGFGFLDKSDPDIAKTYLERMALSGPYANKALLALGRSFSDKKEYKQSLVPWLKLTERDPSDPAVQDAFMAVPFAFGQLEAFKQSLDYYDKAMNLFQSEIDKINVAAEAVSGGKMLDAMMQVTLLEQEGKDKRLLKSVLNTPEGKYLMPLLVSYKFREALHNYVDLNVSLGKMERWSANLDSYTVVATKKRKRYQIRISRVQSKVIRLVEKYRYSLQNMAYEELNRRKERLTSYYNEARFSVAQIYDYASKRWGSGGE